MRYLGNQYTIKLKKYRVIKNNWSVYSDYMNSEQLHKYYFVSRVTVPDGVYCFHRFALTLVEVSGCSREPERHFGRVLCDREETHITCQNASKIFYL